MRGSTSMRTALEREAETLRLLGVEIIPVGRPAPPAPSSVARTAAAEPASPGVGEAKAALLAALRARHDLECAHCTRATAHTRTVFGEGDPSASLMFVGEAPGAEEDRTGRPFVGRAGQLLDSMITAMGLSRDRVFIANVLKARPLDNATPTPAEADRCGVWLREQIAIIQPSVIVTLGKPAAAFLLDTKEAISALRGRWATYRGGRGADGRALAADIPVMATFHPAFLLRQYTPENRRMVWSDLKAAMGKISG